LLQYLRHTLLDAPIPDLLMGVEVLAVDGSRETTKVHKALALRDADDDALIVTVAVRPEHRIANLVHLLLPLAASIAASCLTTLSQALTGVNFFLCSNPRPSPSPSSYTG